MKKKNICDKAKALTFLGLQQPHCGGRRAARLSPAAGLQDPRAQAPEKLSREEGDLVPCVKKRREIRCLRDEEESAMHEKTPVFRRARGARECPCSAKSPSDDGSSPRECEAVSGGSFERETGRRRLCEGDREEEASQERTGKLFPTCCGGERNHRAPLR
ncbi:hypothetical protein ZEAMMB73_Zm00001d015588 [Zea mays]|jgi:hypothetical protein|uniref:Uncharacterized protein n=1 Tax=Zea mays TaxID=4577 RepID=A0A1D6H2T9_MAIZE|nr:hypothetical protein ZEAMMB73_Zm00001d015588 [Zea mays]